MSKWLTRQYFSPRFCRDASSAYMWGCLRASGAWSSALLNGCEKATLRL